MLDQKLQQKLLQKLSPQQIQMIKLLEVPAMQMEERIKKELEENPALEEGPEEEEVQGDEEDEVDDDQAEREQEWRSTRTHRTLRSPHPHHDFASPEPADGCRIPAPRRLPRRATYSLMFRSHTGLQHGSKTLQPKALQADAAITITALKMKSPVDKWRSSSSKPLTSRNTSNSVGVQNLNRVIL